ncbi:hypothetical protein BH10CYA1_BH10CYA1_55410 [soil metagenome]
MTEQMTESEKISGAPNSLSMDSFVVELTKHHREVLVAALLTWVLVANAFHSSMTTGVLMDVKCFYLAAQDLADGAELYGAKSAFLYLPLIPLLLKPLLPLGFATISKIWLGLNLVAFTGSAMLVARATGDHFRNACIVYCGILLIGMHNWAFSMELLGANCDMILALIFSGMILSIRLAKFKTFAILVAVGTAFKFWFFGLVGYLLLRRKFREAALCILLSAAVTALLFQIVGWHQLELLARTIRLYSERKISPDIIMQSISGFAIVHLDKNLFVQPLAANSGLRTLFTVCCDGLVATVLCATLWFQPGTQFIKETEKLCLVLISIFLVTPICHVSYAVVIIPAVAMIIFSRDNVSKTTKFLCFVLYLILTRVQVLMQIGLERGQTDSIAALLVSAPFFWYVALWMVLVCEIALNQRSPKSIVSAQPQIPVISDTTLTSL